MRLRVEEIKQFIERFFEILIAIKDAIIDSGGGGGDTFNQNIITKNWQPMTTFRKGEYVLHNNQMWQCLVDNINQVPIEGTYWKNTNVGGEFNELNNNLKILKLKNKIVDIPSITIDNTGYTSIPSSYYPQGINVEFSEIYNFGSISSKTSINTINGGRYIVGTAGAVITNLRIKYFYYE